MNYDLMLSDCKRALTAELFRFQRDNPKVDMGQLPHFIDELNNAWDKLTDCLVRHRSERDRMIHKLINELAEAKK